MADLTPAVRVQRTVLARLAPLLRRSVRLQQNAAA